MTNCEAAKATPRRGRTGDKSNSNNSHIRLSPSAYVSTFVAYIAGFAQTDRKRHLFHGLFGRWRPLCEITSLLNTHTDGSVIDARGSGEWEGGVKMFPSRKSSQNQIYYVHSISPHSLHLYSALPIIRPPLLPLPV